MRPSTLIAAVFATGALAAPLQANNIQERALVYHTDIEVVTITVTEGYGAPTPVSKHKYRPHHSHKPKPTPAPAPPKPAPAPAPPAPAPVPAPVPAPAPPAPAPAPAAPAPAPYPAPAPAPAASSGGNDMLNIANKYRAKYGLPDFAWSDECAANAKTTGEMNGGSALIHAGRPIDNGQVIGPGASNNFEMAYVGGWLCEVPGGALGNLCDTLATELHIDHSSGDTGHYKILTNPSYKTIGCAWTQDASGAKPFYPVWGGQWVCNLSF